MENSQISPTYFNVTFNPDDRSLTYSLDLNTEISGRVMADVQVFAYGFLIIEKNINLCDLGWKQFCPMYPGNMQVESIEYISDEYVKQIPGIAYTVPDIDAVAKVIITDMESGKVLSCIQSSFTNGRTVSQTGAKWATAVIAGLGLLIAALLSTVGNSNAASHVSANAVSLFLYFQAVVVVSMQSVQRVPPIVSAWSENLAWSMGLIRVSFMQKIFRWYVQSTGGNPSLYFQGSTKQILVQRAQNVLTDLHARAMELNPFVLKRNLDFALDSNVNLLVFRGIKRVGYNSHIEITSIVVTGFTFFVLCGYVLIALIYIGKQALTLLIRFGKINPNTATHFRRSFGNIFRGSLLRYIYIGFTQLVILSLWEFTQNDSPAVVLLAVLFLLLALGMIGYSLFRTVTFGKLSIQKFNNPAALLYGDQQILDKYGFCYTMFHAQKYWFGIVLVCYSLVKGIFIGLCQYSGKASSVIIFILDLVYTAVLIWQAPYLDKSTNIVNYCMSAVNTVNAFLFMFFSDLFGQPAQVSSIMGWIFFILNAAFSLILLIMIIVLIVLSVISKNPDARFAPAQDDRTSFQRKASVRDKNGTRVPSKGANELTALGIAAQDHQNDWEYQMYKLNDLAQSEKGSPNQTSPPEESSNDSIALEKEENRAEAQAKNESLGTKFKRLTRGKSLVKQKSPENVKRISDTLSDNDDDDLQFESKDMLNEPVSFPRDNSDIPINQHFRNPSNSAFSAYSTNPTDEPTKSRGFV